VGFFSRRYPIDLARLASIQRARAGGAVTVDYEEGLTPDFVRTSGGVSSDPITDVEAGVATPVYAVADVTFTASPTGMIWEQGGGGDGAGVFVGGGALIARCGDGALPNAFVARVEVASASQFEGRKLLHIAFKGNAPRARLWIQDADESGNPVGEATLLGDDAATGTDPWAGGNEGRFGAVAGTYLNEPSADFEDPWNGTSHELRIYRNSQPPAGLPTT
jgi:hypothetical protein